MKILEYNDLDISGVPRQYQKLIGFFEKDDFRSAEVKNGLPAIFRTLGLVRLP